MSLVFLSDHYFSLLWRSHMSKTNNLWDLSGLENYSQFSLKQQEKSVRKPGNWLERILHCPRLASSLFHASSCFRVLACPLRHWECNHASRGSATCTFDSRNSTTGVEGNRFLLTGFLACGCWEHSCSEPSLPQDPELSLLLKRLQAKTVPGSSPYPYRPIRQSGKQISIPSIMCTCGFQSHHPLAAALSFRV